MKAFDIEYIWKHVQGHTVVEKINSNVGTIFAEDTDTAIEMFKNLNPLLGQYIRKDSDRDLIYEPDVDLSSRFKLECYGF